MKLLENFALLSFHASSIYKMMIKQMMLNTLCVQMNRTILFPNILEKMFRYTHKHKGTHNYEAYTSIKERLCEERIVCVSHLTDSIPNRCDRNDEKITAAAPPSHPNSNHMTIRKFSPQSKAQRAIFMYEKCRKFILYLNLLMPKFISWAHKWNIFLFTFCNRDKIFFQIWLPFAHKQKFENQ